MCDCDTRHVWYTVQLALDDIASFFTDKAAGIKKHVSGAVVVLAQGGTASDTVKLVALYLTVNKL